MRATKRQHRHQSLANSLCVHVERFIIYLKLQANLSFNLYQVTQTSSHAVLSNESEKSSEGNAMFKKLFISLVAFVGCGILAFPSYAHQHDNGHELVRDVEKPGTKVEFEEDQDEVYEAVQRGYIRPFSEMYAAVERDLHGRIIKVELEEDDDLWVYELKINYNNNIIKVEYNAETLEMIEIRGRNIKKALKNTED